MFLHICQAYMFQIKHILVLDPPPQKKKNLSKCKVEFLNDDLAY